MMSKVGELSDQLKDLKDLLEKIDKAKAGKQDGTQVQEISVDLVN